MVLRTRLKRAETMIPCQMVWKHTKPSFVAKGSRRKLMRSVWARWCIMNYTRVLESNPCGGYSTVKLPRLQLGSSLIVVKYASDL